MKKLITAVMAITLFTSCTVDNDLSTSQNANLSLNIDLDNSNLGNYKGVFTTYNAEYRATVSINLPANARTAQVKYPTAILKMPTGESYFLKAESSVAVGFATVLQFSSSDASFDFSVLADGSNPLVENVIFKGLEADIVVLKDTQRAPVTPVTGTYECGSCNGHPVLGTGQTQTFNFIFTTPDSDGAITTQVSLGSGVYIGIGNQSSCVADGIFTECEIDSGDGLTTTEGFLANGNPVFWTGAHLFNNEVTGPNDCSGVSGTWNWESNYYGTIVGTLTSDANCLNTIYSEDFTGFTGAGFSPTPSAGQLDSNVIIANGFSGSLNYGGTQTSGDYARGLDADGNVSTGGIYAFDVNAGNITLGVQPSGSDFTSGTFDFRIENTTGSTLTTFEIIYDIFVNNDEGRGNSFNFSYSTDDITYTPVSSLDYASPAASDGNGFVSIARNAVFSTSVAPAGFIYLRFEGDDVNGAGSRDEFGLDNIELKAL